MVMVVIIIVMVMMMMMSMNVMMVILIMMMIPVVGSLEEQHHHDMRLLRLEWPTPPPQDREEASFASEGVEGPSMPPEQGGGARE